MRVPRRFKYAVRVLDILSHLHMLNETRDNGIYYDRLTFASGLTQGNYDNLVRNAKASEIHIARRARVIVDKITELETRFPHTA